MNILLICNNNQKSSALTTALEALPIVENVLGSPNLEQAKQIFEQENIACVIVDLAGEELSIQSCVQDCDQIFPDTKVVYISPVEPEGLATKDLRLYEHHWANSDQPLGKMLGQIEDYLEIELTPATGYPYSYGLLQLTISDLLVLECMLFDISEDILKMMTGKKQKEIDAVVAKAMRYFKVTSKEEVLARYKSLKSKPQA